MTPEDPRAQDLPSEDQAPDDPVYLHARREALVVFLAWVVAGVYTISVSFLLGYAGAAGERSATLLGIPLWVVWGVLVPWVVSVGFAAWFCFAFVVEDDLGEEPEEIVPDE
jgi:fatty acid desaturase